MSSRSYNPRVLWCLHLIFPGPWIQYHSKYFDLALWCTGWRLSWWEAPRSKGSRSRPWQGVRLCCDGAAASPCDFRVFASARAKSRGKACRAGGNWRGNPLPLRKKNRDDDPDLRKIHMILNRLLWIWKCPPLWLLPVYEIWLCHLRMTVLCHLRMTCAIRIPSLKDAGRWKRNPHNVISRRNALLRSARSLLYRSRFSEKYAVMGENWKQKKTKEKTRMENWGAKKVPHTRTRQKSKFGY